MDRSGLDDKSLVLPAGTSPMRLDQVLRTLYPKASWSQVRRLVESGKVAVSGARSVDPAALVRGGDRIDVHVRARRIDREQRILPKAIVYVDAQVVVVNKPAGISSVPYEGERDALDQEVRALLKRSPAGRSGAPLGIVHRLDKETSGLLVFCRTLAAKRVLAQQFRDHTVRRRYLAIAHGRVESATIYSRLVRDRGDGLRGSTRNPLLGREATTHVRVVERLEGATLVACRLETGRTHQIRIHLSEAGHPLLGERVYVRGYRGALFEAPRLMLHAAELGFSHPATGRLLRFEQELPDDMREMVRRLRG